MKNKFYVIEYTSNDKWEKSKGYCIITAENRKEAIITFAKKIQNRKLVAVNQVSRKKGLIFNQDVSIL